MKVVVTGIGIVSAAGRGVDVTEMHLVECRDGLGALTLFESPRCGELPVAEVAGLDPVPGEPRTVTLGRLALDEALAMSGLNESETPREEIALSLGTCVGGMPESEQAAAHVLDGNAAPDPGVWLRHESGYTTSALARSANVRGPTLTVSTACSSGAQAVANGAELLRAGLASAVVAGGVDALCRLTLNGFASMLLIDAEGCRPFGLKRGGMNLGEGAAFLVLESKETAEARGARVLAVLGGYANTCDAHHVTAPDPEGAGAEAAMRRALERAGVEPKDVGYVNAHGTGTRNNDLAEGKALARLLGPKSEAQISSTKRVFGHTLGAAGAIEAVVSVLALDRRFVPGTPCSRERDPACGISALVRSFPATPEVALSNSFGFGGSNTVLCFQRPGDAPSPETSSALGMPTLTVSRYAIAGCAESLALPEGRRCALPPAGPHKRRARLPRLALDLAKAATGGAVPETTAVLLGTALGSLTETQAFVENMIRENEAAPMPRAFSASVHNASASRVAIALKARGENQTFVGGELSFVQALFAAARRSATGETGPVLVGALDEVTDYVRVGREHCPSSLDAGEGGAILYCDAPDAPALAMLRLVAFGPSPDAAAWIARHAEGVEADCALVPTAALGEGLKNAVVAPPLTGDHPAAAASAVALAVAVIVGELPPATLGCDAVPSRILVVAASRFGEFGLLLLEAPQ